MFWELPPASLHPLASLDRSGRCQPLPAGALAIQCGSVVGQSASGDEVCVCVATGAMRKLRFPANFSDHKRAPGSRLRALRARGLGQLRSSASGSHVLVTRCVWCLPDHEFTLSLPDRYIDTYVYIVLYKIRLDLYVKYSGWQSDYTVAILL